jgi:hypothetical protein
VSTRKEVQDAPEIVAEGARARMSEDRKRQLFGPHYEKKMNAVQAKHSKWIGAHSVQAMGAAKKKKGRAMGELAIVVFVDQKRARGKLRNPVPRGRFHIPGLGWIKTDVWPIGELLPHDFPNRVRPAMPGCSIGHKRLPTCGSLGSVVRKQDGDDSHLNVLGNSHVLALDGLARKGDAVVQPGRGDAICPATTRSPS